MAYEHNNLRYIIKLLMHDITFLCFEIFESVCNITFLCFEIFESVCNKWFLTADNHKLQNWSLWLSAFMRL